MLRDLAMTWMNRLSLRHSLVPAKSKLTSPRRFWAISCTQGNQITGGSHSHAHERDTGIKSEPFSLCLNWAPSWPVRRTASTAPPLGSCPRRLSIQHRSAPAGTETQGVTIIIFTIIIFTTTQVRHSPCQLHMTWTQFPSDTAYSWWWLPRRQWPSWAPLTGQSGYQEHFHCRRSPAPLPAWVAAGKPSPGCQTYTWGTYNRTSSFYVKDSDDCNGGEDKRSTLINEDKITEGDWGRVPLNCPKRVSIRVSMFCGRTPAPGQHRGS